MMVVLENIRSIHNVGSIFRTADALKIERLYLCGITPVPNTPYGRVRQDFEKVALGASSSVSWKYAVSALRLIRTLRKRGYVIIAVEQALNSIPYFKYASRGFDSSRAVLVLGNEPKGLPERILHECDAVIEIPMSGKKESLNVAVAFGIAAYRLIYP